MEKRNGCYVIHKSIKEQWKKIEYIDGEKYNFTKNYYISNYGRVKNDKEIMKPTIRGKYYRIPLRFIKNNIKQSKAFNVHRLVCEYFCEPNINNLPTVNHIDGNTNNNIWTNLEWASYKYQSMHAYKLDLTYIAKGDSNHLSKITNDMAKKICEYLQDGKNVTEIRKMMNLSTEYTEIIARIRKRKTWKWLSKDYKFSSKPFPKEFIPDDIMHNICKLIADNYNYDYIYDKYKKYFDKFSDPRGKFIDIKNKRSYKRISNLYF